MTDNSRFFVFVFNQEFLKVDYWILHLRPVVKSIFDDMIRKMLILAQIILHILKTYMMLYIISKFRDSSFSQEEGGSGAGPGLVARPT